MRWIAVAAVAGALACSPPEVDLEPSDAGPNVRIPALPDGCRPRVVYEDQDGDGLGERFVSRITCDEVPAGTSPVAGDCDDLDLGARTDGRGGGGRTLGVITTDATEGP